MPATGLAVSIVGMGVGTYLLTESMQAHDDLQGELDALAAQQSGASPGDRARRLQQVLRLQEDDEKNQEVHTRNLWILGSAGTAAVVTSLWLYIELSRDTRNQGAKSAGSTPRLHVGPAGLVLSGVF